MCTVGRSGSNSAMPRLPRVTSTAARSRRVEQLAAGALERARVVADPDAERLLDLRFVRRARRHAAEPQQGVARVDEDGARAGAADSSAACCAPRTSRGVTRPLP